jgi:hypothetical protein
MRELRARGVACDLAGKEEICRKIAKRLKRVHSRGMTAAALVKAASIDMAELVREALDGGDEERARQITDEADALHEVMFDFLRGDSPAAGVQPAAAVEPAVRAFFGSGGAGEATRVRLSTIHKAKGGEADRAFILQPEHIPWPFGSPREAEQEKNLEYVAKTRAKAELIFLIHCESRMGTIDLDPLFHQPATPPHEEGVRESGEAVPPRGEGRDGDAADVAGAAAVWTVQELAAEAPKDFDDCGGDSDGGERFLRRFLRQAGMTGSLGEWDRRQLVALCVRERPAWEVRRVLACPGEYPGHAAMLRLASSDASHSGRKGISSACRTVLLLVHPDQNRTDGAAEAATRIIAARDALLARAGSH